MRTTACRRPTRPRSSRYLVGDGVIRRREGQPRIGPGYDGFRALGNVCHFAVADTALASIAGMPVSLLTNNCPAADIVAYGNSLGGVALASPVGASPSGTIPAGGAVTSGMPAVRTSLMQANGAAASARN